jgi:hypothetical protein
VIALFVISIVLDVSETTFEKGTRVAGLVLIAWAGVLAWRYRNDELQWPRLRWGLMIQVAFGLSFTSDFFTAPGTWSFYVLNLSFLILVCFFLFRLSREPDPALP